MQRRAPPPRDADVIVVGDSSDENGRPSSHYSLSDSSPPQSR